MQRQKNVQFKQQDCERAIQNRVAKVDVEPNARSRTCARRTRLHVRMFKKSEHEQETSNESFMCVKMVCWYDTQDKEKSQETLGGLIPADCVGREMWTSLRWLKNLSYSFKANEFTEFDKQRDVPD